MTDQPTTDRLAEIRDRAANPAPHRETALDTAARAVAVEMHREHGDPTIPVDYFACDARELIDIGSGEAVQEMAYAVRRNGAIPEAALLGQIASAPEPIRALLAQVGALGNDLGNAKVRYMQDVDFLRARLDTAERGVLTEIAAEQAAQHAKFGEQNHPDGTGPYVKNPDRMSNMEDQSAVARLDCQEAAKAGCLNWMLILREEVYEAFAEVDPAALRTELVQVAAVAATWIEAIDRHGSGVSQ